MANQDDGLFLLEVLIDKIVLLKSPCFSDKDFRTCVTIECPAVEPLEICDDEPGTSVAQSGGPFVKTFNNGKSCLFSLKEGDISQAMSRFPVKVTVYKSLPCGCLPTKIVIGEATIDMTKEFVQARKRFLEDPNNVSYQALKDSFHIVGSDGNETGEIVMFLRISCFGKLIITRFQGSGGPPRLGAGGGGSIVDRSCNPQRDFQTVEDPCVCGAARVGTSGGGSGPGRSRGGTCPTARDPYNSMPCEEPDDPCYCSGPKPPPKQQMSCRNTDQYCLHVPKGTLPSLQLQQGASGEQKQKNKENNKEVQQLHLGKPFLHVEDRKIHEKTYSLPKVIHNASLLPLANQIKTYLSNDTKTISERESITSTITLRSKRRSVSFSNTVNYVSESQSRCSVNPLDEKCNTLFGRKETAVYMTLYDDICPHRTSGTQATASINKCLQVVRNNPPDNHYAYSTLNAVSDLYSSSIISTSQNCDSSRRFNNVRYQDVYFFGRKRNLPKIDSGMGSSRTKLRRSASSLQGAVRGNSSQTSQSQGTTAVQTRRASFNQSALGKVSIQDEKDMIATISHIKIGPREPCPVHGKDPCQGPGCKLAASQQEQAPVKVSTVTNPRRGVFELVIRRMTGAPLAKNELMLEWTPPPCRSPPCRPSSCSPCFPPGPCLTSKCKMILCRPSSCKPKCCNRECKKPCVPCKRPCGQPCPAVPCKKCYISPCCGKPCKPSPCRPCPPVQCNLCLPSPCSPCQPRPCRPCPPRYKPCPPVCKPCPPPRCKPCPPLRCKPCKPCVPPRCRPCIPVCARPCSAVLCSPFSPKCSKPCPPKPCYPCPPRRCRPCSPCRRGPCPPRRCRPCSPRPCRPCSPRPCKPSPCCRPCSPPRCKPCRPRKPCTQPCKPCKPCKPCQPSCKPCCPPSPSSPCSPCPPSPCKLCCLPTACSSPCPSPCLRLCPVGRKRPRKPRSHPRIRAHRKRVSPCLNRSRFCPVVRCCSVPGPCLNCCGLPCPPPKCCPGLYCKVPRFCKSSCTTCCK